MKFSPFSEKGNDLSLQETSTKCLETLESITAVINQVSGRGTSAVSEELLLQDQLQAFKTRIEAVLTTTSNTEEATSEIQQELRLIRRELGKFIKHFRAKKALACSRSGVINKGDDFYRAFPAARNTYEITEVIHNFAVDINNVFKAAGLILVPFRGTTETSGTLPKRRKRANHHQQSSGTGSIQIHS